MELALGAGDGSDGALCGVLKYWGAGARAGASTEGVGGDAGTGEQPP